MSVEEISVNLPHHTSYDLCRSRAAYRQGHRLTAVKVYTVSRESQHLLIYNVPSLRLESELLKLCSKFGGVTSFKLVTSYLNELIKIEPFTCVYHVHFATFKSARVAKKLLDNRSFYGGLLHTCYAPELETVDETKSKLGQRRKEVSLRTSLKNENHMNKSRTLGVNSNRIFKHKMLPRVTSEAFNRTDNHYTNSTQELNVMPMSVMCSPRRNVLQKHYRADDTHACVPSISDAKNRKQSGEINKILKFVPVSIQKSLLKMK